MPNGVVFPIFFLFLVAQGQNTSIWEDAQRQSGTADDACMQYLANACSQACMLVADDCKGKWDGSSNGTWYAGLSLLVHQTPFSPLLLCSTQPPQTPSAPPSSLSALPPSTGQYSLHTSTSSHLIVQWQIRVRKGDAPKCQAGDLHQFQAVSIQVRCQQREEQAPYSATRQRGQHRVQQQQQQQQHVSGHDEQGT